MSNFFWVNGADACSVERYDSKTLRFTVKRSHQRDIVVEVNAEGFCKWLLSGEEYRLFANADRLKHVCRVNPRDPRYPTREVGELHLFFDSSDGYPRVRGEDVQIVLVLDEVVGVMRRLFPEIMGETLNWR